MSNDPDDNPPSAYWETSPRARKARKCYECRGAITIGMRYRGIAGIWDREFDNFSLCMQCARLHEYMREIDRPCCFGQLQENIEEAGLQPWIKAMKQRGGFQYDRIASTT
jgi:hypothetical protein